ncbi:hypothetical protein [Pseudomonas sp. DWRC2-2]|uniref:hypothetical protein n=1 Tax=Pseudomonas sp. DWRC2-2 TaxID=2804567 RepID=UPI003CEF2FC2
MLKIETKGGNLLKKTLSDLEQRQMPFALARAQTLTAKLVEAAEIEEMARVFDRPTRFTLNSVFVRPARKGGPGAVVWVKDYASKADAPIRWLLPEVDGGERQAKRSEKLLSARGILSSGRFLMPGGGMTLDSHGNISRGVMQKVLSGLGAQGDKYANSTDSRRSRRNSKRFFVLGKGSKSVGVAQRTGKGSTGLRIMMAFAARPTYKHRLDFYGVADRVVRDNLPEQARQSLAQAVLKAK